MPKMQDRRTHTNRRLAGGSASPPRTDRPTPRKELGQHFLIDRNILNKLVRAAELQAGDVVLEIGPGLGSLTHALADTGARVVAVEKDPELLAKLRIEFPDTPNLYLLEGDVLHRPPEAWLAEAGLTPPYRVVANLPYYITSAILRALLEAPTPPTRLVLMVQREVAQQIVAAAPHSNLLGISVQFYGTPRIVDVVPAGAFFPRPQVDSAIIRVDVAPAPDMDAAQFFQLVRAGFGTKRKQLHNSLARGMGWDTLIALDLLTRAGIDPARRAETLTLPEWHTLYRVWQSNAPIRAKKSVI